MWTVRWPPTTTIPSGLSWLTPISKPWRARPKPRLRNWFSKHLLTEHGIRNFVLLGRRVGETEGLPNLVVASCRIASSSAAIPAPAARGFELVTTLCPADPQRQ